MFLPFLVFAEFSLARFKVKHVFKIFDGIYELLVD